MTDLERRLRTVLEARADQLVPRVNQVPPLLLPPRRNQSAVVVAMLVAAAVIVITVSLSVVVGRPTPDKPSAGQDGVVLSTPTGSSGLETKSPLSTGSSEPSGATPGPSSSPQTGAPDSPVSRPEPTGQPDHTVGMRCGDRPDSVADLDVTTEVVGTNGAEIKVTNNSDEPLAYRHVGIVILDDSGRVAGLSVIPFIDRVPVPIPPHTSETLSPTLLPQPNCAGAADLPPGAYRAAVIVITGEPERGYLGAEFTYRLGRTP